MPAAANTILAQVARELNDIASVRWTVPELVQFFNDGQRDISTHRPDAMNTRITHALVAGTRQNLPAGGEKLIAVNHNSAGTQGVITKIGRSLLDDHIRNWRNATPAREIQHYMYDMREPRVFEVYPPAAVGAGVDLEYAALPVDITVPAPGTPVTSVSGALTISDLFANSLVNYILYRCYRKNTEYAADPGRASAFYQAYVNDLGIEVKATVAVAPVSAS